MTTDSSDVATYEVTEDLTSLSDLLAHVNRDGYASLTDEQIERVVAYRAQVASEQAEVRQRLEASKAAHEALLAQAQATDAQMAAALASALERTPNFRSVSDEQA